MTIQTHQEMKEDWNKFVETLPKRVSETPKEIVADFWLSKFSSHNQYLVEELERRMFEIRENGIGETYKEHRALSSFKEFLLTKGK